MFMDNLDYSNLSKIPCTAPSVGCHAIFSHDTTHRAITPITAATAAKAPITFEPVMLAALSAGVLLGVAEEVSSRVLRGSSLSLCTGGGLQRDDRRSRRRRIPLNRP